jgi:hypothetical protein
MSAVTSDWGLEAVTNYSYVVFFIGNGKTWTRWTEGRNGPNGTKGPKKT